jgi:branched-subunit amino acid transport protein
MTATWIAVLATSAICYLLKYLGMSVPSSWLSNERFLRIIGLMPVALLTALVMVQTFADGTRLTIDARAAGVLVAVGALRLKMAYPVVVLSAAVTSAIIHAI